MSIDAKFKKSYSNRCRLSYWSKDRRKTKCKAKVMITNILQA